MEPDCDLVSSCHSLVLLSQQTVEQDFSCATIYSFIAQFIKGKSAQATHNLLEPNVKAFQVYLTLHSHLLKQRSPFLVCQTGNRHVKTRPIVRLLHSSFVLVHSACQNRTVFTTSVDTGSRAVCFSASWIIQNLVKKQSTGTERTCYIGMGF